MLQHEEIEALKVLVKSMVSSIKQDLLDFALARRSCRQHVFKSALIKHEPMKLIDSPIWGPNLFPAQWVQDTLAAAAAANQCLRDRWGLSSKRKSQEGHGPQSKSSKKTRGGSRQKPKGSTSYKIPKVPKQQHQHPQYAVMQPAPSTSQAAQGQAGQQYVFLQPSPAFHMPYEQQPFHFGQAATGRGSQRRGGSRVASQGRGKAASQRRGGGRGSAPQ